MISSVSVNSAASEATLTFGVKILEEAVIIEVLLSVLVGRIVY